MGDASIVPVERIEQQILLIRGQKVMLDRGLAGLYGVETKALNQAVKRNLERFPEDFMFKLSAEEKSELVTKCDRFESLKHSSAMPHAFTEQGVAMLSSVLKSKQAVNVNIAIMRAFVRLRKMLESHAELAQVLAGYIGRREARLEKRQQRPKEEAIILGRMIRIHSCLFAV